MKIISSITSNSWNKDIFSDEVNYLILNPRLNKEKKSSLSGSVNHFFNSNPLSISEPFILLASSGTTSFQTKFVLLKKSAILNSAFVIGDHFNFKSDENWLCSIPIFHIGGLSILARSFLFKQNCFPIEKWDVDCFKERIFNLNINYCSLVPTQVFDLIQKKVSAPKCLKIVFVGGGILDESLYSSAQELGWPIVKTYGMTETSSMIAYSNSKSNIYKPFPEIKVKISTSGKLAVKCTSLFSYYIFENENTSNNNSANDLGINFSIEQAKLTDEHWETEDLAALKDNEITFLGRGQDYTKINGELVNLFLLRQHITKCSYNFKSSITNVTVITLPNSRNGSELYAIFEVPILDKITIHNEIKNLISEFNKNVLPYERIFNYLIESKFIYTEIGKLKLSFYNSPEYRKDINEKKYSLME